LKEWDKYDRAYMTCRKDWQEWSVKLTKF